MDTLETERARAQRENGVLRLLQQQQQATAATAKGLLAELASERERVALLELRLAERDAHAAASLEELRAAELRGEGREARLGLLQRQIATRASEVRMRDNPNPNPNPSPNPTLYRDARCATRATTTFSIGCARAG